MADAESSMLYSVESYDYAFNAATFTWKGNNADEAVAQFISAMDTAAEDQAVYVLPYDRERSILYALATLLAGHAVFVQLVGHQRITLTRTASN